jgi:hypothetical protein
MRIWVSSTLAPLLRVAALTLSSTGDEQGQDAPSSPEENGGFDGGGVMGVSSMGQKSGSRRRGADEDGRVKAFWIMGRKWCPRNDGGGRMLEHFLELKLENERLKQELKVGGPVSRAGFAVY